MQAKDAFARVRNWAAELFPFFFLTNLNFEKLRALDVI
jgi:hypothetical protein